MGLTRGLLKELGLEADAIERIMEAHGASMSAMVSKTDRDDAIKLAVEKEKAEWEKTLPPKIEPKDTAEYKELLNKYSGLQTDLKLTDYKVKAKYREIVKSKINPDDFDKSIQSIKTEFSEFFDDNDGGKANDDETGKKKPTFADDNKGKSGEPSEEEKVLEQFRKAFN